MNTLKTKIHLFYYIIAFICSLNGYFKDFLLFNIIIIIHELGHIIMAKILKWKIEKIVILPFGALTIFNEKINRKIIEELLIAISGPIMQTILFFTTDSKFTTYNIIILILNLIPILPLDGSKILNLILNKFLSFRNSYIISIYISFVCIIIFAIYFLINFNLVIMCALTFTLIKTIKEYNLHNVIFNKFLFERYIYNLNFKKSKTINQINNMKRDYKHIFYIENKYLTEKEILRQMFDF